MNYAFLFVLIVAAIFFMYVFSRPSTIEDENAKGRYVIMNTLMGYPCYEGRTFLTKRGALRAYRKLHVHPLLAFPGMYEIRKVL